MDSLRVGEQCLAFAFAGGIAIFAWRKQSCPACRDFIVVPSCRFARIDAQYEMQVIAHDRISADRNGEGFRRELDTGFNLRPPVFEGLPVIAVGMKPTLRGLIAFRQHDRYRCAQPILPFYLCSPAFIAAITDTIKTENKNCNTKIFT